MESELVRLIKKHEGLKLQPYRCTRGKLTIGYGRNLDDRGISLDEAQILLEHDLADAWRDCSQSIPCFFSLTPARQAVLVDMCFNLGIGGLLGFKKFLAALERRDYDDAAKEMLDSKWASQDVPKRAAELVGLILRGAWS